MLGNMKIYRYFLCYEDIDEYSMPDEIGYRFISVASVEVRSSISLIDT